MENNQNDNNAKREKKKLKTLDKLILAGAALLFAVGVFLMLRQYIFVPEPYQEPPVAAATPAPERTASPAPDETPAPTPSPTPYVKRIPTHIYFPGREIDAGIEIVGQTEDGAMDTLRDALLTAWYGIGPSPGDDGNALINGHVRWKGKAGTFSILPKLDYGERVIIEFENGSTMDFYVTATDYYPFDAVPAEAMALDIGGEPRVTLISCYGQFNQEARTSEERVFVTLKLTPPEDIASDTDTQ